MATELIEGEPAARELFGRAGEILGLDLAGVCTTGNDALLTRTDIVQPALLTTCLGWLEAARSRGLEASVLAGHSLGEFSAWVAAGALGFEAALRLVRRRGEIMEQAAQRNPGGMLAVIGLSDDQVSDICGRSKEAGVVVCANYNSPGQLVISGEQAALEKAADLVKAAGGRTLSLRVSGAFHSPLMDDAAHDFSHLVADLPLEDPRVAVVANVSAEPVRTADEVRRAMSRQMTSPVLWTASVRRMVADGTGLFVEVGPGNVLAKLIGRISADARAEASGSLAKLDAIAEEVRS